MRNSLIAKFCLATTHLVIGRQFLAIFMPRIGELPRFESVKKRPWLGQIRLNPADDRQNPVLDVTLGAKANLHS